VGCTGRVDASLSKILRESLHVFMRPSFSHEPRSRTTAKTNVKSTPCPAFLPCPSAFLRCKSLSKTRNVAQCPQRGACQRNRFNWSIPRFRWSIPHHNHPTLLANHHLAASRICLAIIQVDLLALSQEIAFTEAAVMSQRFLLLLTITRTEGHSAGAV
jgi:hypothetical protein